MLHLYGHKWASIYGDAVKGESLTSSARQWLYDLRELTPDQVAIGINQVVERRLEWPPGPLEFITLCEGIPDIEDVLANANLPYVREIRQRMDFWNLDLMSSKQRREQGLRQYRNAVTTLRREGTFQLALTGPAKNESITDEAA